MGKIGFVKSNDEAITMAAVINLPEGFDEGQKCPAIVVSHPGGGVKEQTAGTYARKLAERGFVTIAYAASYQGESTGEPRQLQSPSARPEDVSAAIDHLITLPYVDKDRIGAMGICAGAGYTANAAINDRRIKTVSTVSAVNIGQTFRHGFTGDVKLADAIPLLVNGSDARTAEADGAEITEMPLAPMKKENAPERGPRRGLGIPPYAPRTISDRPGMGDRAASTRSFLTTPTT
jgi:fermentation-respiration switch protein FrsA (DUF1100 family)